MESDNRRALLLGTVGTALLGLIACESEPKPAATATLLNNEKVHQAVTALIAAVDTLHANVGRFDGENWRDVVPDVKTGVIDVVDATGAVRKALGY